MRKILKLAFVGIISFGLLTGCGNNPGDAINTENTAEESTETEDTATVNEVAEANETSEADDTTETEEASAEVEVQDEDSEIDTVIKVAASATPHAEILEQVKPILESEGYTLEVTVFDDYIQSNLVVEKGDYDANYFQHVPYMDAFNEEQDTHLVNAGGIHYEPFGIYPGVKTTLDDLTEGDKIAIPNDTTNEARALLLLQDSGIIKLTDGVGLTATINNVIENPSGIEFMELEASQVAKAGEEAALVILNGNYALEAGFSVAKDAIVYESSESEAAQTYVNIVAVKDGRERDADIMALINALCSDEISEYIDNTYDGAVVAFR